MRVCILLGKIQDVTEAGSLWFVSSTICPGNVASQPRHQEYAITQVGLHISKLYF